jgi:hypothetical protein
MRGDANEAKKAKVKKPHIINIHMSTLILRLAAIVFVYFSRRRVQIYHARRGRFWTVAPTYLAAKAIVYKQPQKVI